MTRDDLEQRVRRALAEVRPGLEHDGGDVELVGIDGETVHIRLLGACSDCPLAAETVVRFIAERVRRRAPEITRVVAD